MTRKDENVFLDAIGLAEALFDDHMMANLILLGAAYQAGAIPVSAVAIERAIELNGVAVDANTQAFRAGRRAVADPAWMRGLARPRIGAMALGRELAPVARELVDPAGGDSALRALLEARVPELIAYQDEAYARQYVDFVGRVAAAEGAARPGESRLAEAVARYLFKLMAFKDEYEVARLHLTNDMAQALEVEYPDGVALRYLLHPPILRALGLERKLAVGQWIETVFAVLVKLRGLRGTAFGPFGYAKVRRVERALIGEYRETDRARARHPRGRRVRARGQARGAARHGSRLRGSQAPERRALPGRCPRARVLYLTGRSAACDREALRRAKRGADRARSRAWRA